MRRQRSAESIATQGPASSDEKTILKHAEVGADVFRINFSHGAHDEHKTPVAMIKQRTGDAIR